MERGAVIEGNYRYELVRCWDKTKKVATFIMLNPSTADASVDDPTIQRCIRIAKNNGCGTLRVVNLFAYKSTQPVNLLGIDDPVGKDNDNYIKKAIVDSDIIVLAWGEAGAKISKRYKADAKDAKRDNAIKELLKSNRLYCLGKTKAGHPRHPLFIKGDTQFIPFY